jgi:antitoxin ParD1/3/4
MRTNIDIDDALMDAAMSAGPYKTKKDAVEAGLKLLARQAAYREILKWEGKLRWDGEPWGDRDKVIDAHNAVAESPALQTGSGAKPPSVQERKPMKRAHGRR